MKISKEQLIKDLGGLFGAENVIIDIESLREHDSDNMVFMKSFGIFKDTIPACILNLKSTEETSKALAYCNENEVAVIVRTGGSSYEKLLTAVREDTIVIDLAGMNKIIEIDKVNMMAHCECGVPLEVLENMLQKEGYTTGHSPQSLPLAHMGGLVSTRSIGQFSTYYGGIEDMFCGGEAVLADGEIVRIRNVPRRSSGPDLRHLLLGGEGALNIITEVSVKIFHYYPEHFWKGGYIVPTFEEGIDILREVITRGFKPSVVRLYDKVDYDHNFGGVEIGDEEAYMFFVAEGPEELSAATGAGIERIISEHPGIRKVGNEAIDYWLIHRNDLCGDFRSAERREKFRQVKAYYSTTEIAASWTDIKKIYSRVIETLPTVNENLVFVGGHVSHSYQNGTNIYFVYKFNVPDPEKYAAEHQVLIDTICEIVLDEETGGCVHHHGMGKRRVHFAPREHGSSYIMMKKLKEVFDPKCILNPGALIEYKKK